MNTPDHPDSALPAPPEEAKSHSVALQARISAAIAAAGGAIDFDQYMEMALYEPGYGYYAAGATKLGEAGDFVTAPELGSLFGRSLAVQIADVLGQIDDADVLEFGAGSGALAEVLLQSLADAHQLPRRYLILETSPDLRERQRTRLAARLDEALFERVVWLDAMPQSVQGVVLANEVLDAMPVRRFRVAEQGVEWLKVTSVDAELRAHYRNDAAFPDARVNHITDLELPVGYCSETGDRAQAWVQSLSGMLQQGVALVVDYGYPEHEYYHPDRVAGTLRCHYRHRAHDDAFFWPGLQDITAHVNFTAVARCAVDGGMSVAGYTNQGSFLLALGLLEMAERHYTSSARNDVPIAQEIMTLTGPQAMGESFKVIALSRDVALPLRGFGLSDRTGRLG